MADKDEKKPRKPKSPAHAFFKKISMFGYKPDPEDVDRALLTETERVKQHQLRTDKPTGR